MGTGRVVVLAMLGLCAAGCGGTSTSSPTDQLPRRPTQTALQNALAGRMKAGDPTLDSATTVHCAMPTQWTTGTTFDCAIDDDGGLVGSIIVTVTETGISYTSF